MADIWSRLALTPTKLIVFAAIFLVATGNISFFGKVMEIYPWDADNFGFLISIGIGFACVLTLLMTLLTCVVPARIVVSVFVLLAAVFGYFSDQFGTVIDIEMIRNVLETDAGEVADLLNIGLVVRVMLLGIVPIVAIWCLPLIVATRRRELRFKAQTAGISIAVMLVCLFGFSDSYTGFFRLHKPLRYFSNPTYALYSAGKFLAHADVVGAPIELIPTAEGAVRSSTHSGRELIVMVVGEAARTDRFSLNGYGRVTNPELAGEERLVSYGNISACGTSTAISVPCMFALDGHEEFDRDLAMSKENVLDVLQRAGVSVLWRDNNAGSKGVATRVAFEDFTSPELNPECDRECRDIGMLGGLQEFIDAQTTDILIVLHQMGNHGPAYFKRYPAEYERFTPACHFEELSRCTDEEIGNAYDNAILYTDHFLEAVIRLLKANTPRFETAMLYVSDHGESLGENGLYLHGMPNMLAPAEQTSVPVVIWIGDTSDIELNSALDARNDANSHDAVSFSLLSVFNINTKLPPIASPLFLVNERYD